MTTSGACCSRRTLLGAAGALGAVGLLSACGVEEEPTNVQSSSAPDEPVITDLATLGEEGAVAFETPGGKAIVVMVGDEVVAFSSVCTHQGCTVAYDAEEKVLACPCHGSKFDPGDGAKVLAGPASTPLPTVEVVVDEAAGVVRRA